MARKFQLEKSNTITNCEREQKMTEEQDEEEEEEDEGEE
jgi:hypothetical protein